MTCQATFSESSVRRCRRHYTSLFLAPILLITSITYAAKTDVVELANGDHITGEVTEVQRGKLVFKTDDIGTLSIEWMKVAHLSSKQHFEIEMSSGRRYFGKLAKSANEGMLLIVDDDLSTTTEIPIVDAIRVAVFHESGPLSDGLDGSFDFGYSHTKSTESTQLSFDFGLRHRDHALHLTGGVEVLDAAARGRGSVDGCAPVGQVRGVVVKMGGWTRSPRIPRSRLRCSA